MVHHFLKQLAFFCTKSIKYLRCLSLIELRNRNKVLQNICCFCHIKHLHVFHISYYIQSLILRSIHLILSYYRKISLIFFHLIEQKLVGDIPRRVSLSGNRLKKCLVPTTLHSAEISMIHIRLSFSDRICRRFCCCTIHTQNTMDSPRQVIRNYILLITRIKHCIDTL